MQTVAQQLGKQQLATFEESPRLVATDAIGIELELEGFSESTRNDASRALGDLWSVESDGSLRNGGVEFITNGGLGGETLVEAIETLTNFLMNTPHDVTFRCSTHMHINMLDFTVPQVVKFILTYVVMEPYLFSLAGAYRYSSNFCTPIAESVPFHKRILATMTDEAVRSGTPLRYCNKYTALNISPLFFDARLNRAMGTLEFRGGRAMTSSNELLQQCNILLSIKKYVRDFDGNEEELLNSLSAGVVGTVTSDEHLIGLLVSEDVRERALMNAWALLKSYQESRNIVQNHTRGLFPENSARLSDRELLESLGVDEDSWFKLCRNIFFMRHETNGRTAVQRAVGCFRVEHNNTVRVGIYNQLCNVRAHNVSRELLVQAVYNLRGINDGSGAVIPPTPIGAGNIVDIHQTPLEETLYAFTMRPEVFQALATFTVGTNNASSIEVAQWFTSTKVRVKNRDRLTARLREAGIEYTIAEEEQAALVNYMMRCLMLPFEEYVWRADHHIYVRCAHAVNIITGCSMRVPVSTSSRHLFAFSHHLTSGRMYNHDIEAISAFNATRQVVENEVSRLAGSITRFTLI